jgi:hypothetical protein
LQQLIFAASNFREVVMSAFLEKYSQSKVGPSLPMFGGFYQFVQVAAWIHFGQDPFHAAASHD